MKNTGHIPVSMQAVFLEKAGGPLVVREVEVPVPGPGEVLVRMAAAPVNPSDLARIRNAHNDYDLKTFIPGLEGSGTVVSGGKGILPRIWNGKRVACSPKYPSGGTWAEYMVTGAGMCSPLFREISFEQGSMSFVNPLTAVAFLQMARKNGHKAVINNAAASALGRMIELLFKKHGIPVINIVRKAEQVDHLKALGSEWVLNSTEESFTEKLKTLSQEMHAKLLFDSVCSRQLKEMAGVLPPGSEVVIYGNLSAADEIMINPRNLIGNGLKISGFYLGAYLKQNGLLKNMLNVIKVGNLMKGEMKIRISEKYPLSEINKAIDSYLANMTAGKVLLMMG